MNNGASLKFSYLMASCLVFIAACNDTSNTKQSSNTQTPPASATATPSPKQVSAELKKISFFLTNDLHGHIEPIQYKSGAKVGGMAYLGNLVEQIRKQPEYTSGNAGLFVLDSGDQFQGTLLSNFNEGQAMFHAMNEVGYDAVVPGNHDYDFGPIGWLFDKVTPGKTGDNPREVLEGLAAMAKFPLLSANTYFKNSIHRTKDASTLTLDSQCKLSNASTKDSLDFQNATRPTFLKPYLIIEKAGVRVALIGMDNHATASTTTMENVDDLCFRDEVDSYVELRTQLEGQADVFVLMMHNGNSDNSFEASRIVGDINQRYPNGVHLAATGHTHFIHNANVGGVRVIQDGAENRYFGRVDLFFDPVSKQVVSDNTQSKAGAAIDHDACYEPTSFVCTQYTLPLTAKSTIQTIVDAAEKETAPIAKQHLGEAKDAIGRDRISENAMGNILTDSLRQAAKTDISFMNTGGIRADLTPGPILYENIFEVLPFSNMAVVMNSVPWSVIKKILAKSVQTCGRYGALMASGLKIQYTRTCKPTSDVDYSARLVHVELNDGTVLFDAASGKEIDPAKTFSVATLDFLAGGGSGYEDFKSASITTTLDIARELIVRAMFQDQPVLTNQVDGRLMNLTTAPALK